MNGLFGFIVSLLLVFSFSANSYGGMHKHIHKNRPAAIVIADFGTTYPTALIDIENVKNRVEQAFPNHKVVIAFTSNIIRNIWYKRRSNKEVWINKYGKEANDFLYVKNPLAAIADLQNNGYKTIIVQPTHIYDGEEFSDLVSYINALNSIKTMKKKYQPFNKLVVGRPALGENGVQFDYHRDLIVGAEALRGDVAFAEKHHAALVYMGHGNEHYSTGIYAEFEGVLRRMYNSNNIFVGTVEGFPSLEDVINKVKRAKIKKVVLKPLMVVAGDHANNDMCGKDRDSWKNVFEKNGIEAVCDIRGLGENSAWVDIYINHIRQTAKVNNIKLK